jgi:hypothetical protein
MNVISEPFTSNGCFSGSTVLALSKYGTLFREAGIQDFLTDTENELLHGLSE